MLPLSVASLFRRAGGQARRPGLRRRRPSLAIESLENRIALAVTSFSSGILTVDFNAVSEALTLSNDGTDITLASSAPITGDGATFTTGDVTEIVFTDSGALAGQTLTFNAGTALSLSGGLSSTGVETVTFNNAVTATGASDIDVTAPQNVIVSANLTGGTGGISLVGQGLSTADTVGVTVHSGAVVSATGTGSVLVDGMGGNGGSAHHGVVVDGASSRITSAGGDVSVTGRGGNTGGDSNFGVYVLGGGEITAGSGGAVTITGNGGLGSGSSNFGLYVSGAGSRVTSSGGLVSVSATGNSNTNPAVALALESTGAISSGSNAPITITADSMSIDGTSTINSGAGTTTIHTRTAGTLINMGGADVLSGSPLTLGLTAAELNRVTAGTLVIGRNDIATGTVTVSSAVNPTNATALEVITARDIVVNANITGGTGGLTLNANQQITPTSDNFTGVVVQSGAVVSATTTGLVAVQAKGGTASGNYGVRVTGAGSRITSAGGNVAVTGSGVGTPGTGHSQGVRVDTAGEISAGGGGTVAVMGFGGNAGTSNIGVSVTGATSRITSGGGSVEVTGAGGGTGTAGAGIGVNVGGDGEISAGGSGSVTVVGTGGSGSGFDNYGVSVSGALISSAGGSVSVTGTGGGTGSSSDNRGVYVASGGEISSGGSGSVTIVGAGGTTSGTGNHGLYLWNTGAITSGTNADITITADSVSVDGTSTINSGTGTTTIQTRTAGTQIDLGGADVLSGSPLVLGLTSAELNRVTAGLLVIGRDDIATGTVTVSNAVAPTGATGLEVIGARDIVVNASITGGTDGLTLSANEQAVPTSGNFVGVTVQAGAVVSATGSGAVTVFGTAGDSGDNNHGVLVDGATITSAGGLVVVIGCAGGTGTSSYNFGAHVTNGGVITAGSGGSVMVEGCGGNTDGSGNYGVYLYGANSKITSTDGDVLVTGFGGLGADGDANYGVIVEGGAEITAGGAGEVDVFGYGGDGDGNSHYGVFVYDADAKITSSGGNVSVTGMGGGVDGSSSNVGVYVAGGGEISAGGSASVTVDGEGGNIGGTGGLNVGIIVEGTNSKITSAGGAIFVTATGTEGASPAEALRLDVGGAIASGSNAAITITADSVSIDGMSTINSGTGPTTIRTQTAGTQINLGGADVLSGSPLVLGLTGAELDQITAGTLVVGRNDIATGRVLVSASVNPASATAFEVITARNIVVNASITGGTGGLSLSANQQAIPTATDFTGVRVQSGAVVSATGSGSVTVLGTGGSGSGDYSIGVFVTGAGSAITSAGGAVAVTGTGGGSGASLGNHGVYVVTTGTITAGGSGTVTVVGTGGNSSGTGSSNYGVFVSGTDSRITSSGGHVSVTGSGGGAASSSMNFGVFAANGGAITAGSTGTVTVVGTGGSSSGSNNFGVYALGALGRITSSGGAISVTATGNAGALPASAFALAGGGAVSSASDAAVTITADSVNIDGTSAINSGSGRTTIRTRTAGTQVNLGGADVLTGSPLVLGLTSAELNQVTAGTLTIGRNDIATGRVLVSASVNPATAAALEVVTARNILVNAGITGGAGGLTLSANQQGTPTVANFSGVTVQAGAVVSATGAVTVQGRGGDSASSYNAGVQVNGLNARITSTGGNVSVTGIGGGTGASGDNYGVSVVNAGEITASGTVTVAGTGGTASGAANFGVFVATTNSRITSVGGEVSVTGTGNTGATPAHAVVLLSGGAISSGSNADVTITTDSVSIDGTSAINSGSGSTTIRTRTADTQINLGGADALAGSPLVLGLTDAELDRVTAGTLVVGRNDIATGRVVVSAAVNPANATALEVITARNILVSASITGGAGGLTLSANQQVTPSVANFSGVTVQAGAVVSATGAVTVQGRGGNSASSYNAGVQVNGLNARITSSGGNVSVTGTGGGTGASGDNYGVSVVNAGEITATGSGTVTVAGTGGTASGGANFGVYVAIPNSRITSIGGEVSVTGTGNTGATPAHAVVLANGGLITSGSIAPVTVTADSLYLDLPSFINLGPGSTTIRTRTAGTLVNLGGADVLTGSPLTLGLTNAEISRVGGVGGTTVEIGDTASGTMTLSAAIARVNPTDVQLRSGSNIIFNPGSLNTTGGTLLLDPSGSGSVQPITSGVDATASTVSFNAGSDLAIDIGGTIVDSQYNRLNVTGAVNLTGADLVLSGAYVPVSGNIFTIVSTTTGITGEFAGLPDGSIIVFNGVNLAINYTATTVTLTAA